MNIYDVCPGYHTKYLHNNCSVCLNILQWISATHSASFSKRPQIRNSVSVNFESFFIGLVKSWTRPCVSFFPLNILNLWYPEKRLTRSENISCLYVPTMDLRVKETLEENHFPSLSPTSAERPLRWLKNYQEGYRKSKALHRPYEITKLFQEWNDDSLWVRAC